MPTIDTTGKFTKLAATGIMSSISPWLKKLSPYGRILGGITLAAPALTYVSNRLQGFDPSKEYGDAPQHTFMESVTPKSLRSAQSAYRLIDTEDVLNDLKSQSGIVDTRKLLQQLQAGN